MKQDLVDRIANGTATLLGIDDICERLGISRTTFDRWVRNGGRKTLGTPATLLSRSPNTFKFMDAVGNAFEGNSNISFPPPDIRIGNSPKWEIDTFKEWLRANVRAGD